AAHGDGEIGIPSPANRGDHIGSSARPDDGVGPPIDGRVERRSRLVVARVGRQDDLAGDGSAKAAGRHVHRHRPFTPQGYAANSLRGSPTSIGFLIGSWLQDRNSTRLNSSHEWSSYAVFCLK